VRQSAPCYACVKRFRRNRFDPFGVPPATTTNGKGLPVSILWIILIIVLVLLLLGFFSRGRW
jgi:hypothetical protein